MVGTNFVKRVLRADAALNILGGAVTIAAAPVWITALGLEQTWPMYAFGIFFLVNGTECWLAQRPSVMSGSMLWALTATDFLFTAVAIVVAATDPTGAETWARWALVAIADAAAVVGFVKAQGARLSTRSFATP